MRLFDIVKVELAEQWERQEKLLGKRTHKSSVVIPLSLPPYRSACHSGSLAINRENLSPFTKDFRASGRI